MTSPISQQPHRPVGGEVPKWQIQLAALLIAALGLIAYANSLRGVFVFDDLTAIIQNPSLARIWPPWPTLNPPDNLTVSGRPVANWTFAVNHALGGVNPVGYHVVNILIHIGAGLTLFGIVRRTLARVCFSPRVRESAVFLAAAVATIWTVHPLQTEAVTYVVQRVESLMGLFYLLTLYCFIRSVEPNAAKRWSILAVVACILGMGTKEVMVSAPLTVFLYDRAFVAGNVREALRQRWGFYFWLATSWALLALLVVAGHNRGGSAGFVAGASPWHYGLTQFRAILHYLWLVIWPHPLVFDYGAAFVRDVSAVVVPMVIIGFLLFATLLTLWRNRPVGWLGFWFFAILAPSSSVMPVVTQSMAEHRLYLSLAAVVVLVVSLLFRWIGRWSYAVWPVCVMLLVGVTIARNRDYRSEIILWNDTIEKAPGNPRAYDALGNAFADAGKYAEAADAFRRALGVDPNYCESHNNLGAMLNRLEQTAEAKKEFEIALSINPKYGAAHFNLGELLGRAGDYVGAKAQYLEAIRDTPGEPTPLFHLAGMEMQRGDVDGATEHFQQALRLRPTDLAAWFNLGFLLSARQKLPAAIEAFSSAVKVAPRVAAAHYNLANALAQSQRLEDAANEYNEAVRLEPDMVAAHFNLGNTLALLKRYPEAIEQYETVVRLDPNHAAANKNLAEARLQMVLGH